MAASDPRAVPPAERWAESSVLVAFAFHCNLACTFCMVEDVMNVYEGTRLDAFRSFTEREGALAGVRRIIFSGGEVTLAKNLLEYVAFARSLPGIEHVRLQTNGTRLADRAFLRELLAAGADEYFVSIHGHDAATCDAITQRKGSFEQILEGMRAVVEEGGTLFTNTAIAASNVASLPEIVELVAPFGPRSIELWSYWPRADERGEKGHFVRAADAQGPLLRAIRACLSHGIPPAVKWFPKCLLGDLARYHDDGQPPSVIPDDYFTREPSYGCIYEGVCVDAAELASKGTPASGRCAGLSEPYIHRFGWEADLLVPKRGLPVLRDAPSAAPRSGTRSVAGVSPVEMGARSTAPSAALAPTISAAPSAPAPSGARPHLSMPLEARSLVSDAGPRRTEAAIVAAWLDRFGLGVGKPLAEWQLASAMRSLDGAMLSLAFHGGGRTAIVRVCARDERRRAIARTRSFDFFYAAKDAPAEAVAHLLAMVVGAITPVDDGSLALPLAGPPSSSG